MKLNLGAGELPLEGYLNLDGKRGDSLLPLRANGVTMSVDGSREIPSASCDEVRASHVLEHFPHHQTLDVLKEWVRVLKPGGWLKIAVPDLAYIFQQWNRTGEPLESYLFGGQIDQNDYHKAAFDAAKLGEMLGECGLINIQPWKSEIQDCASLPVSLNLMGQKPESAIVSKESSFDEDRIYRIDMRGTLTESAPTLGIPTRQSPSRLQVFANGRWQDMEGEVRVASQEELEDAQAGKLPTRKVILAERRSPRIALCMSTPRQGFLRPFERLLTLAHSIGAVPIIADGVFWHHALSRGIEKACNFYYESDGEGFDFILTADYDTYVLPEDLKAICELLGRSPEADCIVPLQMKRGATDEVLANGANLDLTLPLVPINTGHFGFTLFRKEFFERLPKPWFYEKPDIDNNWGDGRIDADIGFWLQAKKAKLNIMLAPGIPVGHGEELVVYPKIENGKVSKVYQTINHWMNSATKPEGVGVASRG